MTEEPPTYTGLHRERITRTAESTCGGGRNADRGTASPRWTTKRRSHRLAPGARPSTNRRTTARCSTKSAVRIRECAPSNRCNRALVELYGGQATTRNGRPGSRTVTASACTTVTASPANRFRSSSQRPGCSSTATTRAPAATRCSVRAPCPAPRSRTSSPGRMPASETMRAAQLSRSWYQPHDRRVDRRPPRRGCRRWSPPPDTTDHHHEAVHALNHRTATSPVRANFPRPNEHPSRYCQDALTAACL